LASQKRARRLAAKRVAPAGLLLALALMAGVAAAKIHGTVPPRNPAANVAPRPNYSGCKENGDCTEGPPCYSSTLAAVFDSAACEQGELRAIDDARAKEGVGPMHLPSNFNSLSADEQLLVTVDLERVGRGLPPFQGIVESLDSLAQAGTHVAGQRPGTFEDPSFPRGFSLGAGVAFGYRCHQETGGTYSCDGSGQPGASIAAGDNISALDADYDWMYDDGPGGSNNDCRTRGARGCWGHRDNILGRYPTQTRFVSTAWGASLSVTARRPATLVMGAGALEPNGAGGPQGNFTAIFASIVGPQPAFVYTWKQALAAGANAPAA
jgi:hypothetical protein